MSASEGILASLLTEFMSGGDEAISPGSLLIDNQMKGEEVKKWAIW
jgi:hypothetical protein